VPARASSRLGLSRTSLWCSRKRGRHGERADRHPTQHPRLFAHPTPASPTTITGAFSVRKRDVNTGRTTGVPASRFLQPENSANTVASPRLVKITPTTRSARCMAHNRGAPDEEIDLRRA
jgi:hypothetical protein